jgi:hypothetical protein
MRYGVFLHGEERVLEEYEGDGSARDGDFVDIFKDKGDRFVSVAFVMPLDRAAIMARQTNFNRRPSIPSPRKGPDPRA